jgi:hypothetical protein
MPEVFAEKQTTKACTEHDDMKCFIARHGLNFNESGGNAKRDVHQIRMAFILTHGLMARLEA